LWVEWLRAFNLLRTSLPEREYIGFIEQLAHEEHTLREAEGHRALTDDERKRLVWLEQRLDQCWDLLRQRRALIDAGRDPNDASVRGVDTVEHYQQ
jgi:hypothetical protein